MKWSRIADTTLGKEAWKVLESSVCQYHNSKHVLSMYDYLEDVKEPYDACLDWAVLFHDIVYDQKPEKELRSAKMFLEMSKKFDDHGLDTNGIDRVQFLIMETVDHKVTNEAYLQGSSAIIRADLHALANPVATFYNFHLIMKESMWLYDIDEYTFAENNIKFMEGLYDRVSLNMIADEPEHVEFYDKIIQGIRSTANLSKILLGK